MIPGPEELLRGQDLLRGQIDGAITIAKLALSVIGAALGVIITLIAYVFMRLEKVVDMLRDKSNGLETRTAILETWRKDRDRVS